jgi:hypothetical protein
MNPTVPINGFTLIDSAQRSHDHPDTWAHPDGKPLRQIEARYLVKVGVTHPELSGERFWGLVKERIGNGFIIQIDQDMRYTGQHGLTDKDILLVTERNVFGIVDSSGTVVWEAR